ncbi:oligosaccharyltransferase complex subunit OSTC-like [Tamandua tetradactyla]|uniref:oligosaccharyltransferase complex subunit OSTC-like n=1 Tax=Tamandua tetradactyla TaxID=48850 RepID=UPI004053857C
MLIDASSLSLGLNHQVFTVKFKEFADAFFWVHVRLEIKSCPLPCQPEHLYQFPLLLLECPNLQLKKLPSGHMLAVMAYFLVSGGATDDVVVEPPSLTHEPDHDNGHERPIGFLAFRVNGQYTMERLASNFLFTMGGLGCIILDQTNAPNISKLNKFLLFIGFVCVLLSFSMARVFMRMKLPGHPLG